MSGLLAIAIMMAAAIRWWGRGVGVAAGWVLLAMPLWNLGSHFNSLDIGVSAALTVALGCFLIAQHPQAGAVSRRRWMLAVWAAMGVAVLTKGLMGLVLPGLVLVVYTLWSRDWALWARMHIGLGLLVFAGVTVPWFALVTARNPEFAHFFFIHEHFQRYTSTVHQRHEPWWFFIPLMVAGFLPWSGLWRGLVACVREAPRATSVFQPERLLAAWVVAIFVFFSASGSKLPGYILPVMPALAVLGALALERLTDRSLVRHLWGCWLWRWRSRRPRRWSGAWARHHPTAAVRPVCGLARGGGRGGVGRHGGVAWACAARAAPSRRGCVCDGLARCHDAGHRGTRHRGAKCLGGGAGACGARGARARHATLWRAPARSHAAVLPRASAHDG